MKKILADRWQFILGYTAGDEQSVSTDAREFQMPPGDIIDLDNVAGSVCREGEDGIVYNRFTVEEEGSYAWGFGCDWWIEVFIDGKSVYSTFPGGNAAATFTTESHAVLTSLDAGEHLLACHVKRGTGSWLFAFAQKDPESADPCRPLRLEGDISLIKGAIKPMNAVNNGPIKARSAQSRGNFDAFKAAEIPYARNHDAAFWSGYGGEHIVDVHAIFPNFSADPEDPASYDFELTDKYLQNTLDAGTQIFYRLGSKIEHNSKKYGTKVPPDFQKWAVISEHIIRHYNEGWANGFQMNIIYWEIWNEADLDPDDAANKRTWQGTEKEFFEFYRTAAFHLKKCFPHLKIGGPALSGKRPWMRRFLAAMSEEPRAPMDFFSWHFYGVQPRAVRESIQEIRQELDKNGFTHTESNLNEWNYVRDWGVNFPQTINTILGLKGAIFASSVMCVGQDDALDMLMYYDARPCAFNGMFDFYTYKPLKTYYAFLAWAKLAKLGTQFAVDTHNKNGIYSVGAADKKGNIGLLINRYWEPDELPDDLEVTVDIKGVDLWGAKVYLLDEDHDLTEVPYYTNADGTLKILMQANTLVYIEKTTVS